MRRPLLVIPKNRLAVVIKNRLSAQKSFLKRKANRSIAIKQKIVNNWISNPENNDLVQFYDSSSAIKNTLKSEEFCFTEFEKANSYYLKFMLQTDKQSTNSNTEVSDKSSGISSQKVSKSSIIPSLNNIDIHSLLPNQI